MVPVEVPAPVAWFWAFVEVGEIPFVYAEGNEVGYGSYTCSPDDVPFCLCPDLAVRGRFAVTVLRRCRAA